MTETKTDRACGGNDMIRIAIVEDEDMYAIVMPGNPLNYLQ